MGRTVGSPVANTIRSVPGTGIGGAAPSGMVTGSPVAVAAWTMVTVQSCERVAKTIWPSTPSIRRLKDAASGASGVCHLVEPSGSRTPIVGFSELVV